MHWRGLVRLVLASLILAVVADGDTVGLADAPGFEIESTLQKGRLLQRLSTEGAVITHTELTARPGAFTRQFIFRNRDNRLWALDGERRTYYSTTLDARLEVALSAYRRAHQLPGPGGGTVQLVAPGAFRLLPDRDAIDGHRLTAFELTTTQAKWRIWYATGLPRLKRDLAVLALMVPLDGPSQRTFVQIAGYPLVRVEAWVASGWHAILDTTAVRQVVVRSSELTPPATYEPVEVPKPFASLLPPGGFEIPASVIRGPGPEMSNPEVHAVFWGQQLNDPAHAAARSALVGALNRMVSRDYTRWLHDYNIRSAALSRIYSRPELPPRSVGGANFPAIGAMVYDVGFKDGGPLFWWQVGGHDPMYVLLVTDSEVDGGGWGGYHLAAGSLTHAVLPFPASLFAHDAMPWAIVRIKASSLGLPAEAQLWRQDCARRRRIGVVPALSPATPALCSTLEAFDDGTMTLGHEFVETASDPFLFFGWSDPTKQPFYSESEIADICEDLPFEKTVVGETVLGTYWSNSAGGCVPEPYPQVTILEPVANTSVTSVWGNVVLRGLASDPSDGDLSAFITWVIDGVTLPNTPDNQTRDSGPLSAGQHLAQAAVTNGAGLSTTAAVTFSVAAVPVKVSILSPTQNHEYATGEHVVYRGDAFVYQPGDISDDRLVWDDNGAPIGTGPLLFFPAPAVGQHTIRLSVMRNGVVEASAFRAMTVVTPPPRTRLRPSIVITLPAPSQRVLSVSPGSSRTAATLFTATAFDGNTSVPPNQVHWRSDVDGSLGTGLSLTTTLSGGACAATTHRITATVTRLGGIPVSADTIVLTVGQPC